MKSLFPALYFLGALALLVTAPSAGARSRGVQVDDDRAQCPQAQFTSIAAAVAAAAPGDTILVCPGLYQESVVVNKTLTLRGTLKAASAHSRKSVTPDPTRDAIVEPPPGGVGFLLEANGIVVQDFVFRMTSNNAGLTSSPLFSGYLIQNNAFLYNTIGIFLNSSGQFPTRVRGNLFQENNTPGSAAGNGIYSDAGLRNASIEQNYFTGHINAAITLAGAAGTQSDIRISRNVSEDDARFLLLFNATDVEVDRNRVTDTDGVFDAAEGPAILIGGGNAGVEVEKNDIGPGPGSGIVVSNLVGSNTGILIAQNDVSGRTDGIRVTDPSPGVALVEKNRSDDNRKDGIFFGAATSGNRIEKNQADGNAEHDCHDDSTGPNPGGVANLWSQNKGDTENRPGLCRSTGGGSGNNGNNGNDGNNGNRGRGRGR